MTIPTDRATGALRQPLFPPPLVDRYCEVGHHRVEGWLDDLDARIIRSLGRCQSDRGYLGGVAEIGIYHGRLFILLYLLLQAGEHAVAIDTFETDPASGGLAFGDRARFEANLARWAGTGDFVHVFQRSSDSLRPAEITASAGRIRLFSIDGLHLRAMVKADLGLADRCLSDQGIIIVDDCFNPVTPGVSDGIHDYFQTSPDLVPFAISSNKVFLCRPPFAAIYRAGINKDFPADTCLQREFLEYPVDIYWQARRKKRWQKRWLERVIRLASAKRG